MSRFDARQTAQLLRGINDTRVLKDGKGHSHVSQQDITAHLIRVFGFGGFDTELLSCVLVFEQERHDPKTGEATGRWDVCYSATMRLTVRDGNGAVVCHYEDGSTATAQNQTRGDAHDLAMKSAISLAKKRTAINLGDQFGLSLYNRGQIEPLVRGTLVKVEGEASDDVQAGVPQQVEMGNDETPDNGRMTAQQKRAHNSLKRDVLGELPNGHRSKEDGPKGERLPAVPEDDPWYSNGEPVDAFPEAAK